MYRLLGIILLCLAGIPAGAQSLRINGAERNADVAVRQSEPRGRSTQASDAVKPSADAKVK